MGRNKIADDKKNKSVGVSLPVRQLKFIKEHKDFDFSKFVQLELEIYIQMIMEYERRLEDNGRKN